MKRLIPWLLCVVMVTAVLTGCNTQKLDNISDTSSQTESSAVQSEAEVSEESSAASSAADEDADSSYSAESKAESDSDFDIDKINANVQDFSKYDEKSKDEFNTDPVPEGMQEPVEPGDVEINKDHEMTCYLTISCSTILDNMGDLAAGKDVLVPSDGNILARTEVVFYEGESVFDVLQRETMNRMIHMESNFTPMYNSAYIKGIGNIYEFDCGSESGWMYCVNGWYPNYGVSRYVVQDGDEIEFRYTCDLGRDL